MPLRLWGILLLVVLLPLAAQGRDLRFITIDAAPWASRPDDPTGAFPALVRELERRTGHAITISLQSFPRVERDLDTGEQDCTILMWTEARARLVERGETVYAMPFGIIARKGVRLADYDDLRPLTISVVRGLFIDARFDADGTLHKDFDKDYVNGLQKLAHGRLDAVAGALPTLDFLARQEGVAGALGDRLVLGTIPLALQCSRRSPNLDVLPLLNQSLRAMVADGTLARVLVENHYP